MSKTETVKKTSPKSVREVLALNFSQKLTTNEIEEMECELLKMLELLVNVELSNFKEIANESCYFSSCTNGNAGRRVLSGCPIGQIA